MLFACLIVALELRGFMTGTDQSERSLPRLTAKQRDVLALIADNRTSKEIAGLLGISESAVNQRIEIVRARLGGLPRGELARLYRQEFSIGLADDDPTWQKIHLPANSNRGNGEGTESIAGRNAIGSHRFGAAHSDGSQLSAFFFGSWPKWLASEDRIMVLARSAVIAATVLAAMLIAVAITNLFQPGLSGS